MRFTKMHGAGNDYIFVDCRRQNAPESPENLAGRVSDRHFGIGGDGLVLLLSSDIADVRMRMFNADGSEAEMCGNAVRCVAVLASDHGRKPAKIVTVETARGVLDCRLQIANGRIESVQTAMGEPIFESDRIPTTLPGNPPLDVPISVAYRTFAATCVSMGNPHCVIFVDDLTGELVTTFGPQLESHSCFPNRTNVEFVRVDSESQIAVKVWERGSGATLACGTGACAAVVAAVLTGRTGRSATVQMPGGNLHVDWPYGGEVFLSGPAVEVFTGTLPDG